MAIASTTVSMLLSSLMELHAADLSQGYQILAIALLKGTHGQSYQAGEERDVIARRKREALVAAQRSVIVAPWVANSWGLLAKAI